MKGCNIHWIVGIFYSSLLLVSVLILSQRIRINNMIEMYFLSLLGSDNAIVIMKNVARTGSITPSIGYTVGGAKDINTFTESVNNNYLPLASSITFEGIFSDYYFGTDVNNNQKCEELFCPTYSSAVVQNPFSNATSEYEYYLSVGLNSGMKANAFHRNKLNLVIVLDISGSMSSTMRGGCEDIYDDVKHSCSNLDVAKESIIALLTHLNDDDRIAIVTFNQRSQVIKPLNSVSMTDLDEMSKTILNIQCNGGTNLAAGYKEGTKLFDNLELNDVEYDNRVILLTDAMPNVGLTDGKDLLQLTKSNAQSGIYTTFIGIGINFNSDLIETITKCRGANYYSVHSYNEFMKRMDSEFEYMVTPVIFNVNLSLKSTRNKYTIDKIYGSPESDESTWEIMKMATLFPSTSNNDGEIKGGIILIKLKLNNDRDNSDVAKLKLVVQYEDRNGTEYENFVSVIFAPQTQKFDNYGIRKAVLLSQYVQLMKTWIEYETENVFDEHRNEWDSGNRQLKVDQNFKATFANFLSYFKMEMELIGDITLRKEFDTLQKLAEFHQISRIEL